MKLVIAAQAEADLEQIADYIAADSPVRALSFVRELRQSCMSLLEWPESHSLVPRHEAAGIRRRVHGNYLIFFRVNASNIEVLHILHGAMDYERILFGE
ncbi:MAG: type II toxin-antitoxin system RelE/ParE family toxin [Bosea sp. (in: a-proteobacteria)]